MPVSKLNVESGALSIPVEYSKSRTSVRIAEACNSARMVPSAFAIRSHSFAEIFPAHGHGDRFHIGDRSDLSGVAVCAVESQGRTPIVYDQGGPRRAWRGAQTPPIMIDFHG